MTKTSLIGTFFQNLLKPTLSILHSLFHICFDISHSQYVTFSILCFMFAVCILHSLFILVGSILHSLFSISPAVFYILCFIFAVSILHSLFILAVSILHSVFYICRQYFTFCVLLAMIVSAVFLQASSVLKLAILVFMATIYIVLIKTVYVNLFINRDFLLLAHLPK